MRLQHGTAPHSPLEWHHQYHCGNCTRYLLFPFLTQSLPDENCTFWLHSKMLSTLAPNGLCRHHHQASSQPNVHFTNQICRLIFFLLLLSPQDVVSQTTAADNHGHRHWKGNYSLWNKRRYFWLKQLNARSPGDGSSTHIASISFNLCLHGHLMSAILWIGVLLEVNK